MPGCIWLCHLVNPALTGHFYPALSLKPYNQDFDIQLFFPAIYIRRIFCFLYLPKNSFVFQRAIKGLRLNNIVMEIIKKLSSKNHFEWFNNFYCVQYCCIFFLKNVTLRSSWSIPSTPSSMLIHPSNLTLFNSVKIVS